MIGIQKTILDVRHCEIRQRGKRSAGRCGIYLFIDLGGI
jgi:hypothetical protein